MRNFLADIYNHPELGRGILLDDPIEGAHPIDRRDGIALRETIEYLDSLLRENPHAELNQDVRMGLARRLFKGSSGVSYNYKWNTVELRFLRSQKDPEALLLLLELFEGRLQYLDKLTPEKNIVLRPLAGLKKRGSIQKRLAAFRQWVEEADLSWEKFRPVAPSFNRMRINSFISSCARSFGQIN